jgi:hypothetical protein
LAGTLERVRLRQPGAVGDTRAVELDLRLPDRARRALSRHRLGLERRRVCLDEEALTCPILVRACPDDDDVGDGAVADPALCAVEHPTAGLPASGRLERYRVGAVGGLGDRESSDRVQAGPGGQPALLLLFAAEQVDRFIASPDWTPRNVPRLPSPR